MSNSVSAGGDPYSFTRVWTCHDGERKWICIIETCFSDTKNCDGRGPCTPEFLRTEGASGCGFDDIFPPDEEEEEEPPVSCNVIPSSYDNSYSKSFNALRSLTYLISHSTSHLQSVVLSNNQNNGGDYHFTQTGTDSISNGKPSLGKTKYYPIRGSTLAQAEKQFKFPDEKGDRHASKTHIYTHFYFDEATGCVTKASVIITPEYPNWIGVDGRCEAVRNHWKDFMKGSAAHEGGHIKDAQGFFDGLAKELIGKTKEEAAKIVAQWQQEYKDKYATPYDERTNHGVEQGAGLNTNIKCTSKQPLQNEDITEDNTQPLSSGGNLQGSNEESDPDFGDETNEEQSEEEELREEIEDDVDECDLYPDDPFCVALEENE